MIRNNEYVSASFLSTLLDMSQTVIKNFICRAEFDKYRKIEHNRVYVLNNKEVRDLLKDLYVSPKKVVYEDYIATKQFASILNYSHTTIRMYSLRPEFAPYRKGNKIKFCEETKQLFKSLIRPRFCKGEKLS